MARTNQRLINLHGSNRNDAAIQSALTKGELAVLHVDANDTMLGTLDNTDKIVWFISSAAVWTAIENVTTGASGQITRLSEAVSGLSSTTITIENNLASVSAATKPMLTAVTMSAPTTGAVTGNYIEFTTDITGDDYNKVETIGTKLDVIQTNTALSAVTATGQLVDALAIRQYVEGVSTGIQGQITSINSDIDELSATTFNIEDKVNDALAGLTIDDENSVKTYVDSQIGEAVSKAYTVQGSVADYAALTALTGTNIGDVYNVVAAGTSAQTPDQKAHSEGTNWVWTESGWDALGGTVDLSNYVTRDEFAPVSTKANSALQSISGDSGNEYITVTMYGSGDHRSAFTVTEQVATSFGSIASTEKKTADAYAIQEYAKTLKNEAVTSAYTASSAITYNVETGLTSQINNLDDRIDAIEGSVTAVTFAELTSGGTVVGGTNANRQESGVAAQIENNTLKLDLDCLVVDCGTF